MDAFQLNEAHPRLEGINDFYRRELSPWLQKKEQDRLKAKRDALLIGGVASALIAVIVILGLNSSGERDLYWVAAVVTGIVGMFAVAWRFSRVQKSVKAFLLEKTCGFLDMRYRLEAPRGHLAAFESLRLLPRHTRSRVEDEITGELDGVDFHVMDAKLSRRSGRSNRTVFRGVLVTFQVGRPFVGTTIVARDKGWLGKLFEGSAGGFERIELDDEAFERQFDVYSDSPGDSRALLDRAMVERLRSLSDSFGGRGLAVAFRERQVLASVNRKKDLFEAGSLFQPLDDPRRVQAIVDDIGFALSVAEALNLKERVAP